jgi:hypothetical protein
VHQRFRPNPPASPKVIAALIASLRKPLPAPLFTSLHCSQWWRWIRRKHYIDLWKVEELLDSNKQYQVDEYAPDLFLVGFNGGGEACTFNLAKADGAIYQVPFFGMSTKDAWLIAKAFDDFIPSINLILKKALL